MLTCLVDCRSQSVTQRKKDECTYMFYMSLSESLLDAKLVARETRKYPVLSKVRSYILDGWPERMEIEEMKAFWSRQKELDCVIWGNRVVIPSKLREWVLQTLHSTHVGIVGMKSIDPALMDRGVDMCGADICRDGALHKVKISAPHFLFIVGPFVLVIFRRKYLRNFSR